VLRLTASIGISIYPDDGDDAESLINGADAAMYHAKRHELGGLAFHDDKRHAPRGVAAPPLDSLRRPVTRYELALAEHERRHAELREANEQLVMAALTAQELQTAAERAHQRQAEFMAVVAEELSNPLAPIRLAAAMLGRAQASEPLLPRAQAIIEQQVETMLRLVGSLRDVSQIHAGKLILGLQPVDLVAAIDAAVAACRPAMDTRLQRFDVRLPVRRIEVLGEPARLQQIIRNLLDNASKFTPDHGVIELTAVLAAGAVVLTLADNGIGISPQALPTIFEPFMQDVHAIGYNGVGLGIGLTVVRALVQAHGGRVSAHSAGIHRGSQFVVTLPLDLGSHAVPGQPSELLDRSEPA
jgi:signal transduction histidine kinase